MRTLIIIAIVVVAWALLRSTRAQRRAWVQRLALPGTWLAEVDGVRHQLDLRGSGSGGRYREHWVVAGRSVEEQGAWQLRGNDIEFRPDASDTPQRQRCNLRLFAPGRIGIDGPGRERRVYERQADNVVPLVGRH